MSRINTKDWTYGVEHELGDWNRQKKLPTGAIENRVDHTVMNSNGIAADPAGKTYHYGGEINTVPTKTPQGQVEILERLKKEFKLDTNHRNNLHIHIRVPGLKDNLVLLKQLAFYNHNNLPKILNIIEPIPKPSRAEFSFEEYEGAMLRYKRRLRSHHSLLSTSRYRQQQICTSLKAFFEAEAPIKKGEPQYHLAIRSAVNVRQLLETDTIEFRHFPQTLDGEELLTAIEWCREYLIGALLTKESALSIYNRLFKKRKFPMFPDYIHWKDRRFKATQFKGNNTREQIEANIKLILSGKFDSYPVGLNSGKEAKPKKVKRGIGRFI